MNKQQEGKGLQEVYSLRFLLVLLLVTMHSFNMFTGSPSWPLPEGIQPIGAYGWISKTAYSFMLETFVFISGYLFSYQLYAQKKDIPFGKLIKSKFRRLLLPSILFGLLYLLLFERDTFYNFPQTVYSVLCGVAHLWFLPMLFWCFLMAFFISKWKEPCLSILAILFFISIFSFLPLPLQLSNSLFFLFFFYLGMYCWKKKDALIELSHKPVVFLALWGGVFNYVHMSYPCKRTLFFCF